MDDIEFFPIPRAEISWLQEPEDSQTNEPEVRYINVSPFPHIVYKTTYWLVWLVGFLMLVVGLILGRLI